MKILEKYIDLLVIAAVLAGGGATIFFGMNLAKVLRADALIAQALPAADPQPKSLELPSLKPKEHYEVIARRNIFSMGENGAKVQTQKTPDLGKPVESQLNLRLKGTVISPKGLALAMIEDPTAKKEDLYTVGDKIQDAEIVNISPHQVIVERGGRRESLSLFVEGPRKGEKAPTGKPAPSPPGRSQQSVQMLMGKLRLRPHMQDGKPSGFVIGDVPKGSAFESAGLRTGDIVVSINNQEVKTPNELLKAYKDVSEVGELLLDILRDGQSITVKVDIESEISRL
jgi:general secretion pathway protein C